MSFSGKEKYYKILGIAPTDDVNIIKKAYRKLALKYHPDVNPNPKSHQLFIEINAAYEILTNQRPIPGTKTRPEVRPKTPEEILAEQIRQAKERYENYIREERDKDRRYFLRITTGWRWKLFKGFSYFSFIMGILLSIDYFATGESYVTTEHELFGDGVNRMLRIEGESFLLDKDLYWYSYGNAPVMVQKSLIFKDFKCIRLLENQIQEPTKMHSGRMQAFELFNNHSSRRSNGVFSVYIVFPYLHIMLFVPILVYAFKRPTLNFSIWRLVSIYIVFPVITFIFFLSSRPLHFAEWLVFW